MAGRRIALALTLATLALPAPALAQSAGDNQYVDPLAGQHHHTAPHGTPRSQSAPSSAPSASSSPSSTSSPSASAPVTPSGAQPAQAQAVPLARTGFDAWIPALAGMLLLGAAALLRRSGRAEHS